MLVLLLFFFWLILNGTVTVELILVGVAVSAALAWLAYRVLGLSLRADVRLLRRLPGVIFYLCYLLGQVILSNLQVMRVILSPGAQRPKLVWFPVSIRAELSQLTLANSITLTPGTVTVALGENRICVYALRPEMAQGLESCGFVTRLEKLEGERHG